MQNSFLIHREFGTFYQSRSHSSNTIGISILSSVISKPNLIFFPIRSVTKIITEYDSKLLVQVSQPIDFFFSKSWRYKEHILQK